MARVSAFQPLKSLFMSFFEKIKPIKVIYEPPRAKCVRYELFDIYSGFKSSFLNPNQFNSLYLNKLIQASKPRSSATTSV
jgi:hypothetical protein